MNLLLKLKQGELMMLGMPEMMKLHYITFPFQYWNWTLNIWNMNPNEIEVQTNNFVEVSTAARVHMNVDFQKFLKYIIGLGVLLFVLILVISMTSLNNDESETLKQCLPGHYKFPDCIRKSTNQPIWIFLWS